MPVITITHIRELLVHVQADDRLYLDLDETLMACEPDASAQFECAMQAALERNGLGTGVARAASCWLWQGVQGHCTVGAVEGMETSEVLAVLQERGVEVVGLTARGPRLQEETTSQLAKSGLGAVFNSTLSLGAIAQPNPGELALGTPGTTRPPVTHAQGIIYCGGSRKPQAMLAYEAMRTAEAPSGKRVLVDDLRGP